MTDPSDGLDGLIERLALVASNERGIGNIILASLVDEAAAALVQLREEVARLELWGKATFEAGFQATQRAERAEAEVARLQQDTAEIDRLRGENARLNALPVRILQADLERLQAENRLLRECARTPDLWRIDAAIDAARSKP